MEILKDNWKTVKEHNSTKFLLTDTCDSVQVFASIKIDISSKVQVNEDIKRAIADSRIKPVQP